MKLVSVIIINWNGLGYLKQCLPSLNKQKYKNIEVIVVDNASIDGSVEYIKENYPKIKIIINKKNLGFAEANDIGYRRATGEYILLLNNDTEVTADFLINLVQVFEKDNKKEIGALQSKLLLMDQPDRLDSVGAFLTPTGFLYHYGVGKKDSTKYNKPINLYTAKGACMILRKSVIDEVSVQGEMFDSKYFAYFEETDLCHRIWLAGYRIVYVPDSIIYHKNGGTSSKISNTFVQYHSFKNRINSYLKNFGTVFLCTYMPIHILFCESFAIFALFRLKGKLFLVIQKAIWWNISNLSDTLTKRRFIQHSLRKRQDSEIKKMIMRPVRLSYYYHLTFDISKYEE